MRRSPSVEGPAADVDDAAAGEAAAASTSALVIRPPGPLPVTCARSTPFSLASWRTNGAARTSAPASVTAGAPRAFRRMPDSGAPGPYPTSVPGVASAGAASAAAMVTSASPTATESPGRAWSFRMVPAYGDGITTTALAVSTSQSGVLTATVAPSSTRQATSWASVRPSPRSGRRKVWSAIGQRGVRGLQDAVDVGQVEFFVARRGIGHIQPANAPDRRLEAGEGVRADA